MQFLPRRSAEDVPTVGGASADPVNPPGPSLGSGKAGSGKAPLAAGTAGLKPVVAAKGSGNSAIADADMTPNGPTDRDPLEQEAIHEAVSMITDGNLEMTQYDMPAYFRILSWVNHQPTKLLRSRAKRDVLYTDFQMPKSMRLQIVELELRVMEITAMTDAPKNGETQPIMTEEGHPIYEVHGVEYEKSGQQLLFWSRDRSSQGHAHRKGQHRCQISGVFL